MRLTKEQIEKVSSLILEGLKGKGLIEFKTDERKVLDKINDVILSDMRAEDALDREVEEILKTHASSVNAGKVDYRKMFQMIKTKLARERGIVL